MASSNSLSACGHIILVIHFLILSTLMSLHADAALSFSYDFSTQADRQTNDLKCINDASPAGDRINLTKYIQNSTGRVYHPQPVRLWNRRKHRASFTTSFSFAIGGNKNNERGDGMAFFIGPPDLPLHSWGAFLGLFTDHRSSSSPPSSSQTVGVEFDTCRNLEWDPNTTVPNHNITDHIGIDINSIASYNYTELPNLALFDTMSANITYDGGSKMMRVSLLAGDGKTYSLERQVDFRDAGVPQYANVGFSAKTGNLIESHQLLSWSFHSKDPSSSMIWVILMSIASVSLVGLIVALLWVIMVRRQLPAQEKIELQVAKEFSYNELSAATENFSKGRFLGAGAFGEVYRGDLRDPRMPPVAVKRLKLMHNQTRSDYINEIMTLGQLSHRNLIKLVGWCDDRRGDDKLLLVYELVTNRSVDEHLHDNRAGSRLLAWSERYRIVLGVAAAIDYLHNGYRNLILHRDIKPSNVMLDDDFEAKLGDFGLVRQVWDGQGSLGDTTMVGSWNYIDPKCTTTGTVSTASDMYSFGILLLEVATGKNPVAVPDDGNGSIQNNLVSVVRRSHAQGTVLAMADERLNGDFDRVQMERMLLVGLLCVHEERLSRPGIKDALNLLLNIRQPIPETLAL